MTVELVKVSDLLKYLKDSADGYFLLKPEEWFRMMVEKCSDGQFATLIRLIETEGFTDPIGILRWQDDLWEMGNGHHRLCAAILLGLDEIPVVFGNKWPREGFREKRVNTQITPEDIRDSRWISDTVYDSEIGLESELVFA